MAINPGPRAIRNSMPQDKILKLLELTKSSNDAEALNAIRKANDIREKADMQWEDVFAKTITTYKPSDLPPFFNRRPQQPQFLTVETMFREILHRDLSDLLRSKIEQLKFVYEWTQSLDGEEVSTLINTYNRNCF